MSSRTNNGCTLQTSTPAPKFLTPEIPKVKSDTKTPILQRFVTHLFDFTRPYRVLRKPLAFKRRPLLRRKSVHPLMLMLAFAVAIFANQASLTPAAAQSSAPLKLVKLDDVKTGALLFRAKKEGHYVAAPVLSSDVDIKITGPIARAIVTQRFQNPTDGWVEGKYVFPLTENAAVDKLKMIIGTRIIEGKIKERKQAKIIYETAKREGKKAALVEQLRPNMFANSVANIGPGETIVVQIEYQQTVRRTDNLYRLRVPLVVAPRYSPRPGLQLVGMKPGETPDVVENDPVPDRAKITPPVQHPSKGKRNPVSLSISLNAGFPLGDIKSHHHKVKVEREGPQAANITLADGIVPADKDFELTWSPNNQAAPSISLFKESMESANYVLAIITPPAIAPDKLKVDLPRDVIFVIDNSGSMGGQSIRQAKQSLLLALGRLKSQDKFNIVRFDNTMELVFPQAVDANEENLGFAKTFVSALEAKGGTEMLPALKAALIDASPDNKERLRQIVFLTDGAIGNERQLLAEILNNRGRSRIFTVGIGSAPNSYFMTRAAMYGRGTFTHIGSTAQITQLVTKLLRQLETPVVTNLEAAWPGAKKSESWPNPLPDLYLGEPIVVTARLKQLDEKLTLSGSLAGKPWTQELDLSKARPGNGIGKLWARRKIASLEGRRNYGRNMELFDKAILKTALDHELVSRLTSLVAVDVTRSRPDNTPITSKDIPLNLPAGWNFEKVFGPVLPLRDAKGGPELLKQFAQLIKTASTNPAKLKTKQKPKGVALPEAATLANHKIITGILALVLTFGLTFLLVFWRHLAQVPATRNTRRSR